MERTFSGLRLFLLAMIAIGDRTEITRAFSQALTLLRTRPDLMTDWIRKELRDKAAFAVLQPPAAPEAWFAVLSGGDGVRFRLSRGIRLDRSAVDRGAGRGAEAPGAVFPAPR